MLLMMKPSAMPALCTLLGDLQQPAHQGLIANALVELAKDTPEVVLKHLTDRRPAFVRNLLGSSPAGTTRNWPTAWKKSCAIQIR